MPSVSKKQHDFMEAVAHSEKFAKKVGVPEKVGKEFVKADEHKKDCTCKECMGGRRSEIKSKR